LRKGFIRNGQRREANLERGGGQRKGGGNTRICKVKMKAWVLHLGQEGRAEGDTTENSDCRKSLTHYKWGFKGRYEMDEAPPVGEKEIQ